MRTLLRKGIYPRENWDLSIMDDGFDVSKVNRPFKTFNSEKESRKRLNLVGILHPGS